MSHNIFLKTGPFVTFEMGDFVHIPADYLLLLPPHLLTDINATGSPFSVCLFTYTFIILFSM